METRTTVVIGDPDAMVREGLKALLERTERIRVVAGAASGEEAIRLARRLKPDVTVLAFETSATGTLRAIRKLSTAEPSTRVLALTSRESRQFANDAIRAGAMGCVDKSRQAVTLVAAVDCLAVGRMHVPRRASGLIRGQLLGRAAGPEARLGRLSPIERDVFTLTVRGFTAKEIADRVSRSPKSVENARARVRRKLGLKTRAELVSVAMNAGLLRPGD